MIHKLEVENFMSLRKASVCLDPLTIFIGPNSSGKSAIFKAFVVLSKLLNGTPVRGTKGDFFLESGITLDDLVWNGDSGLPIKFRVWFHPPVDDQPGYTLELRKRIGGWSVTHERIRSGDGWIDVGEGDVFEFSSERKSVKQAYPFPARATLRFLVNPYLNDTIARPVIEPILKMASTFGQAWRYRPSAIDIASFVKRPTEIGHPLYVAENGWGLAAKLQDLHNSPTERKVFEAIEQGLCKLFPHIQAIGFENDFRGVRLSYRTNRSYDPVRAPQESDGVLLSTFLLWRLHTAANELVCFEEPENGLHPLLLADRFGLLRKAVEGGRQILVSTHSGEFLRVLKAHPTKLYKYVRLVQFTAGDGTSIEPLSHFAEATKLLAKYQDDLHSQWGPIIENWEPK